MWVQKRSELQAFRHAFAAIAQATVILCCAITKAAVLFKKAVLSDTAARKRKRQFQKGCPMTNTQFRKNEHDSSHNGQESKQAFPERGVIRTKRLPKGEKCPIEDLCKVAGTPWQPTAEGGRPPFFVLLNPPPCVPSVPHRPLPRAKKQVCKGCYEAPARGSSSVERY